MKKYANLKVLLSIAILTVFLIPQESQARDNTGVADFVKWAFADVPDMITIAQCESGIRQYSSPDVPLKGGGRYIGIFQIDEQIHNAKAKSLGFDIYTPEGNIGYARYMYGFSGTNPWKGCLKTPTAPAQPVISPTGNPVTTTQPAPSPVATSASSSAPISGALTANLNIGMSNPQVLLLQKILNKSGFVVAPSGPGSVGNETSMFGSMTRESVRKFQCAKMSICSGTESTNGYGRVGPMTRNMLNQAEQ